MTTPAPLPSNPSTIRPTAPALPPFLPDICAVFAKRWAEPAEFPANCEFYEEIRSFGVMETISEPKTAVPQTLFQYLAVTSDLPIQVKFTSRPEPQQQRSWDFRTHLASRAGETEIGSRR